MRRTWLVEHSYSRHLEKTLQKVQNSGWTIFQVAGPIEEEGELYPFFSIISYKDTPSESDEQ